MARELKNLVINRIMEREIREQASRHFRGRLIDIGCGDKPYRDMLKPYVTEHAGVDHEETPHDLGAADAVSSAYALPWGDDSFDSALCTAVLEHLEEPLQALRECCRILVPGGKAMYTVPFIWHLHEEPRDFYRYSMYGIRYLFEKAGFDIIVIKPLSGFWLTFGQLSVYNLYRFNRGPLKWLRLVDLLGLMIQGVSYCLDRLDRTEIWTWMYMVVAEKRAEQATDHD